MESAGWDARYAAAEGLVWGAEPNRFVVAEVSGLAPGRALAAQRGVPVRWEIADLTAWTPPADGGTRDALDTVVVAQRP